MRTPFPDPFFNIHDPQAGTKAKLAIATATKQITLGIRRKDGEGRTGTSPVQDLPSPPPIFPPGSPINSDPPILKEGKRGRGKIIGEINEPKEMKKNPKV